MKREQNLSLGAALVARLEERCSGAGRLLADYAGVVQTLSRCLSAQSRGSARKRISSQSDQIASCLSFSEEPVFLKYIYIERSSAIKCVCRVRVFSNDADPECAAVFLRCRSIAGR